MRTGKTAPFSRPATALLAACLALCGAAESRGLDRVDYFVADKFEARGTPFDAVRRLQAVIFFKPLQPAADGSIAFDAKTVAQLERLRRETGPATPIILGIGSLTPLVDNPAALRTAIVRLGELRSLHGFKGIDIDWEDMPEAEVPVAKYASVVRAIAGPWRAGGCVVSTSHAQGSQYRPYAAAVKDLVDHVNLQFYFSRNNAMPLAEFERTLDAYVEAGLRPAQIRIGLPSYAMVDVRATRTRDKWRSWSALVAAGVDVERATQWTDPKNGETYHFSSRALLGAKIDHARARGFAGIFTWELTLDMPYAGGQSVNRFIDDRTLGVREGGPAR